MIDDAPRPTVTPKPLTGDPAVIRALAAMTPTARLATALDLSEFTRSIFRSGLRRRHPELAEPDLHRLYLDRLALCHNRNY